MRAYYFGVKLRLRWFCQGAGGQLTPLLRVQRIAFPGGLVGMGDGGDNQERVTGIEHGVGTREQRARRGTERSAGHRGDIQGMRAVAVLLVMLGHARISGLTGGYVGVDVFFVISGFLITGILVREVRRTGRISIVNFYARRARRILPAATVVLLAVVLVSSRLFNYVRVDQVTDQVTWAAFFAANLQLAGSGSDYFAVGTFVSPVQHYWSLAVEEQFYLVWPALIALILYAGRRGLSDRPNATSWRLRRLAVAIALLCAASFAWSVWYTTHQPLMAYYSAPARGWELGSGALLALCATRVARLPVPVKALASWLGLVAIAVAAVRFTPHTPLPGYHAALPVLGAALVVAGGNERYGAAFVLDRLVMRWVGDISYSLYLWHWPVLMIPPMYLVRELTITERVALLGLAVLLAWLSYALVETPLRSARVLSRDRRRALVLWPATAAIVLSSIAVVQFQDGGPAAASASYQKPDFDPDPTILQNDTDPAVNAASFAAELARAAYPLPKGLKPALEDLTSDVSRPAPGCFADRDATKHKICAVGDLSSKHVIVLYGDSHVTMWLEPLKRIAEQQHLKVVTFMKASCFPAEAPVWRSDKQRAYTECDAWRTWAYAEIAKLKPERIVVSGLIVQNFTDPATGRMMTAEAAKPFFATGVKRTLQKLRTLAPRVDVLSGTPNLRKEPADCLAPRNANSGSCAVPPDQLTRQRNDVWKKAAAATGAHFVDLIPWFCDRRTCPLVIGNVIVYRDANHITTTFATTLTTGLTDKLGF